MMISKKQITLSILILGSLSVIIGYVSWKIECEYVSSKCAANLGNLSRAIPLTTEHSDEYRRIFALDSNLNSYQCPACKKPYTLSLVTPNGEIIKHDNDSGKCIIAWCPQPCHNGSRNVLLSSLAVLKGLKDDQISWYYQKRIHDLSPDEKRKEMEYRTKNQLLNQK